jgi:hypothetical protein
MILLSLPMSMGLSLKALWSVDPTNGTDGAFKTPSKSKNTTFIFVNTPTEQY